VPEGDTEKLHGIVADAKHFLWTPALDRRPSMQMRHYRRGNTSRMRARDIMDTRFHKFKVNALLITDIDQEPMFIHGGDSLRIAGVWSLLDAAQARSGSCRACIPSPFMTPE
jgi:hypothetical protein